MRKQVNKMIKHGKFTLILVSILLVALFVIKILPLFLPLKYSVKKLPQNATDYIVVEGTKTTGYWWTVIGNQDGMFEEGSRDLKDINIRGEMPIYGFYDDYSPGSNKIICYGKYVHVPYDGIMGHCGSGEDIFVVDHWDIKYPIDRDLFERMIPNDYLCLYDFYYSAFSKRYGIAEMLNGLWLWNYKDRYEELASKEIFAPTSIPGEAYPKEYQGDRIFGGYLITH